MSTFQSLKKISGAPPIICESLTPNHGTATPQSSPSPYSINLSSYKIQKGGSVDVTISGASAFQGFIIQARYSRDLYRLFGKFTVRQPDIAKAIQCLNESDTVTHTSPDDKPSVVLTWTAPEDYDGPIVFT